jgi:hypothetical protein
MPAASSPRRASSPSLARASALALVVGLALGPAEVEARERPSVATDAFYVGTRLSPGAALLAGWDLDVYLSRDRAISIGPGVSVAVLGPDTPAGTTQDILVAVDVARFKLQVNPAGEEWRPYFMVGGGFAWVRQPAQVEDGITVATGDGPDDTATGARRFPARERFLGIVSFGAGADLFVGGPWALSLAIFTHARAGDVERLPELWADLMLGIRFGL